MKLKELCERTGITKRNVHYYIKEGLNLEMVITSSHRKTVTVSR